MKNTSIEVLISNEKMLVREIENEIQIMKDNADIDEEDVIEPEDLSHQNESNVMKQLLTLQVGKAKEEILKATSFLNSKRDKVEPGALVKTTNKTFLIGASLSQVKTETNVLIGISTKAPIYTKMRGLKINNSFAHAGVNYTILKIN